MDKTLAARLSRIRAAAASRQPEGRGDGLQVKRADVCGAPAADGRTLPPASAPPAHSLLDGQTRPPPAHSLRDGQARPSTPEADFSSWEQLSPLALRRTVVSSLALPPLDSLSSGLGPLCPGSARVFAAGPPRADRLLFFDLETTGLSGGAGTVAFLAAFGRLRSAAAGTILGVSQYLLLDYSGEAEFLEAVRGELEGGEGGCDKPRLVSYNGRTFDSQILRTRFLMNAMPPVDPPHLDLVYPARRLWRRKLENCSLSTIERSALGLEREDDLPGSEAPDAWFGFLKTGDASRLLRVCEHNVRDLEGLASLLARVDAIARDPLGALDGAARAGFEKPDAEALALRFLAAAKASRQSGAAGGSASGAGGGAEREGERSQEALARALLERAASSGAPRAAFVLGTELAREGKAARAAELRALVAGSDGRDGKEAAAPGLRSAAYGLLAADARRRLGDPAKALSLLEAALSLEGLGEAARAGLERRRAAYAADAAAADADVASAADADVAGPDASAGPRESQ